MALNPTMTRAEREAFLSETHVGILSVHEPGRGPCTVPIWYRYAPGDVVRITAGAESRKVRLMRDAGRASLCAQIEAAPNKYVTVEGPVEIVETDLQADQREMALRYLGPKRGERYLAATVEGRAREVLVILRPERWWSVDFSKLQFG